MKPWKILLLIGVVSIFGLRMYFAKVKRDKQKEQEKMMRDLSTQQMEERNKKDIYKEYMESTSDSVFDALDKQKSELDSIGLQLRKSHEKFKERFKEELGE